MQRSDYSVKRRTFLIMASMGLLAGSARLGSCSLAGATMGTTYTVVIREPLSPGSEARLQADIDDTLGSVVASMSTYERHSELSKFNASTSMRWRAVTPDLFTVLQAALKTSQLTQGAFDITLGPLIDLWGFGQGLRSPALPDPTQLDRLRGDIGYAFLSLDPQHKRARKQAPGLQLDLSSIAKGYGVDKVSTLLEARGFSSYLVEIGGDIRVRSRGEESRAWRLAVDSPGSHHGQVAGVVALKNGGIATSGNYRDYFEQGNRRYPHILNPASGAPVIHPPMSVTVVADTAMEADALATALLVMGPTRGYRFATANGLAASFVELTEGAGRKRLRTQNTASMLSLVDA